MSDYLYIAVQDDDDGHENFEMAGTGMSVDEAVTNCYCEDDSGEEDAAALINVYKYEGTYRKKVEVQIEKLAKKKVAAPGRSE